MRENSLKIFDLNLIMDKPKRKQQECLQLSASNVEACINFNKYKTPEICMLEILKLTIGPKEYNIIIFHFLNI